MNDASFIAQMKEHEGIVFKLVNLYAADGEDRKDLVQEIMYQAWKGYPKFEGRAAFSTWLYRICLNTIFTQKRKKNILEYKESLELYSPKVEEPFSGSMEAKLLYRAIRSLPEADRAIISLHLDGYENADIADIIGISDGNVRVKLHRIKKQLTIMLKD
ncbi:MAG TPA: sigma-70 family RNA polymerase sigma factor [Chitinophagaceae bacterium]|nr:sigma-70 family RNA polymerase sigma factor [Chitinophagaceae bacterium]